MLEIKVPGLKTVRLEHLVIDYNGTLAVDGNPLKGVEDLLWSLSEKINIHVLTADTHGTVAEKMPRSFYKIAVIPVANQINEKEKYVKNLGWRCTAAIGNGMNDCKMLKKAALGIAVVQKEGAALKAVTSGDILCTSIHDALELFLRPKRLTALLRR